MQKFDPKKKIASLRKDVQFMSALEEMDRQILEHEEALNNLYARRIELVRDYPDYL